MHGSTKHLNEGCETQNTLSHVLKHMGGTLFLFVSSHSPDQRLAPKFSFSFLYIIFVLKIYIFFSWTLKLCLSIKILYKIRFIQNKSLSIEKVPSEYILFVLRDDSYSKKNKTLFFFLKKKGKSIITKEILVQKIIIIKKKKN